MANRMLERCRRGEVMLGLCHMYPAAGIIEGMGRGWDFVWIDTQHGSMDYDQTIHAVRAAEIVGLDTLIRVRGHDYSVLGPYADMAPSAVMAPMVETVEQAQALVQGLRFPPLGNRSYGGRRTVDLHGREYYRQLELMVIAQIETVESAKIADRIIGVEGVDCLFFGPDDMKVRMGIAIDTPATKSAELRDAMARTADAARGAGKFAASVAGDAESVRLMMDMGYQLLVGGGDVAFLRTMAGQRLAELRQVLAGRDTKAPGKEAAGMY